MYSYFITRLKKEISNKEKDIINTKDIVLKNKIRLVELERELNVIKIEIKKIVEKRTKVYDIFEEEEEDLKLWEKDEEFLYKSILLSKKEKKKERIKNAMYEYGVSESSKNLLVCSLKEQLKLWEGLYEMELSYQLSISENENDLEWDSEIDT
ncbi:MAG: hypothetical protein ACRCZ2_10355 [Fusobacteriaceae bacterium]